jgi:hypothetical protein
VEIYMAFTDFEQARIERAVEAMLAKRRPSSTIREGGDLGYRVAGQSIEIFEIRPLFRDKNKLQEFPRAKATFVENKKVWSLYWLKRDLRWHRYEPMPTAGTIEEILAEIDSDPYACFWG